MAKKEDADEIRAVLEDLRGQSWLGRQRRAWPRHAYHYTDVQNAAEILGAGRLLSRQRCLDEGIDHVDAASSEVVAQSPWARRYVRLYFRPRTSVQLHHEGHKTREIRDARFVDAHCPVPVFLLFDLEELLTEEECSFSDGNLARADHKVGGSADFLREIPFRDVYRDKPLPGDPTRRDQLLKAIHAEVLFEGELDMTHLRHVVCRSGAERETLLMQLEDQADRWRERIRLEEAAERLYFRRWGFVRSVQLVNGRVVVQSEDQSDQTFEVWIRVFALEEGETFECVDRTQIGVDLACNLPISPRRALVRVDLNGELAFRAILSSRELF